MRRKRPDIIFIACFLSFVYSQLSCEPTKMNSTHPDRDAVLITSIKNNHSVSSTKSSLISTNHIAAFLFQPNISRAKIPSSNVNRNKSQSVPPSFDLLPKRIDTQLQNSVSSIKVLRRSRRDVLLLYKVVSCATGCNPMHLMGYGCYCGFMGAGIPVDGIDKCCQVHDWCYDRLPCPSFMLYFIPYKWQCRDGSSHCYTQNPSSCGYHMCQCDRVFAECLKQQPCPKKKAFCKSAPWRLIQNLLFDFGIAG